MTRVGVNSSMINNILTVTISNLEMHIQYAFSIAAVTAAGRGPYTAYVNQTTAQDVPTGIPVINSLAAVANTLPSILSAVWTDPTPTTQHGRPHCALPGPVPPRHHHHTLRWHSTEHGIAACECKCGYYDVLFVQHHHRLPHPLPLCHP